MDRELGGIWPPWVRDRELGGTWPPWVRDMELGGGGRGGGDR